MSTSRVKQVLTTVVARFFGKGANFLVLAILARTLSVTDLGIYGYIFISTLLLAVACDMGVRNSVAYFIGKEQSTTASHASLALVLFFPFGIIGVAVTPLVVSMVNHGGYSTHTILIPAVVNMLALLFIRMQQGVLLGMGQISKFNRTELVPRLLLLGGTTAAAVTQNLDLVMALYILAVANLCGAISVLIAVFPTMRGGARRRLSDARALIARGFVFMLGVVAMLAAQKSSFLIVSSIGAPGESGILYGLLRLTEIITEIGLAVSVVVFSNSVRAESKENAIRDVAESTRICLAFFSALGVVVFFSAPLLLPVALGGEFAVHSDLFRILLIGTVIGTVWTMIFPTLTTIEHPVVALVVMVPNLILGAGLTWLLYVHAGLIGASWAMVISQFSLTTSMLLAFRIRHGVDVRNFLILSLADIKGIRNFRAARRSGGRGVHS